MIGVPGASFSIQDPQSSHSPGFLFAPVFTASAFPCFSTGSRVGASSFCASRALVLLPLSRWLITCGLSSCWRGGLVANVVIDAERFVSLDGEDGRAFLARVIRCDGNTSCLQSDMMRFTVRSPLERPIRQLTRCHYLTRILRMAFTSWIPEEEL